MCAANDIELRGGYDNPCHDGIYWDHYCTGNVWVMNSANDFGAVCDSSWGPEEAKVVCRQLGYNIGSPICGSRFGNETHFSMVNVQCSGSEDRIQDCIYSFGEACTTGAAAGAECYDDDPSGLGTTFPPECQVDETTTAAAPAQP